jgi:hypothetical protein
MAYIGQSIKNGTFTDLGFTGTFNSSTTDFNLGTQVGSAAQLLVSKNGVIQRPGTDYTLATGGTQISFTTAPASGDSIFIVEISGAVGGTITPSDDSVTANSIADDAVESEHLNNNIISGQTALAANPATDDEFLISDAGTIKRIDAQFFQNTPAFHAHKTAKQTIATGTATLVTFEAEDFDTDSAFDLSNERFTPQVAGKYFLYASIRWDTGTDFDISYLSIAKNGNDVFTGGAGNVYYNFTKVAGIVEANGSTDYFTVKTNHNMGSNLDTQSGDYGNYFGGFKVIGA